MISCALHNSISGPETSENSKSLPKISFDRKSKQIKLTHTILTAPQQSTSGTRFPQPSTSALKFFQESTVVPGSPQQSTVIPGSPQQSTVVPGSPQQSTVVPGSPQQSIPNQTSKGYYITLSPLIILLHTHEYMNIYIHA